MSDQISDLVAARGAEIIETRRYFHGIPEVGFEENETAKSIADRLSAAGLEVETGIDVYAGTTNLTGQIDVKVTAVAADTTIGKVESLIREAESTRTQKQELIEQLASYYFSIVVMVAAVVWFFTSRNSDEAIRSAAAASVSRRC